MKNSSIFYAITSFSVLAVPATATADTYKTIWDNRPFEEAESKRSMLELEWCIAKSLSDYGAPNVFHGEKKTSISNFSGLSSFNSIEPRRVCRRLFGLS
ncbi:hypothetical protein [Novosphingobium terrae]|uniref:hypothetical protein n=1 Tax=Novosphingobium terrae TaxID=2726189 RepID=UPI001980DB49|nr:hypothetical protein [Novosphingobium terrae]